MRAGRGDWQIDWRGDAAVVAADCSPRLDAPRVKGLVDAALDAADAAVGETIDLGIAFVGAEEIHTLNAEHRGVDHATDVLSFPIDGLDGDVPGGAPRQLGDVVVCPSYVAGQVAAGETMLQAAPGQEEGDATLGEALARCIVHGVLHLCGFDHERGPADAREMYSREQQALDVAPASVDAVRLPGDRQ